MKVANRLMRYYFAYGSNMSARQMQVRCPGAQAVGWGVLTGWQFRITTRGTANIYPKAHGIVHGVIWKCREEHIDHLDRFEGVHRRNYLHRYVPVLDNAAETFRSSLVYVSLIRHYTGVGRVDYLRTAVIPGAKEFDLPQSYINELESWLPAHQIGRGQIRYRGIKRQKKHNRAGVPEHRRIYRR